MSWKLILNKDQFLIWGDNVPVTEQEDLTILSKRRSGRVGHDLFHFANKVEGLDWKDVWQALTGDGIRDQSIAINKFTENSVEFVELFI